MTKPDRKWAIALAVAAAYYLGARVGFLLRFPPATTSVLWPPNALLTAALLLTPPRRFWLVILAALPAHLLVQVQAGFPPPLIAALFVTNCVEAVLAAALIHRWSDDPTRFDSLRRALIFVGAGVLLAPIASSFADAAAVAAFRAEPYGLVFIRRVFSNVLSQLAVVPSAVLLVRQLGSRTPFGAPGARRTEAAVLATGLLATGALVFYAYQHGALVPGGAFTGLPVLMPLLVLAAVRFGPLGASLSLLAAAVLATAMTVSAAPVTTDLAAEERVRALQVFLSVVGVPLLLLSALVEERRQASEAVKERLHFESLVSEIAAAFVHLPSHEMPRAFATRLRHLAEFLGLDQAVLWQYDHEKETMIPVAWWFRPDAGPIPDSPEAATLPAPIVERLLQRTPFLGQGLASSPIERDGVGGPARSYLALPLVAAGEVLGTLAMLSLSENRAWSEPGIRGARLLADVFASALARQRAEDALRASEAMKSAVLSSLTSRVAVLDRDGRIIAVNESWTRWAGENPDTYASFRGIGTDYLELLGSLRIREVSELLAGIQRVLSGQSAPFGCDYAQATASGERWFHLMVVPLNRPEGGAVLSHTDISERRQAETQAQQSRDELAHYLRVSTIGELTTSIAHQLNQPLTAILANAQAARRLLRAPVSEARRQELDEILEEIVAEDRRADEVIRGMRMLLRKADPVRSIVDINVVVDDVLRLLATDVVVRGVTLHRRLAQKPLLARGDRVQLQQVLLNLLINALESLAEARGERVVSIASEERPDGVAAVSVADTGPGLPPGSEGAVFNPFYSTKANGMGMGLSIAKSIVEAHGGAISAERGEAAGASFTFTLPLASQAALQQSP